MQNNLSYRHAVTCARLMYEREGFQVGQRTPGEIVGAEFGLDLKNVFAAPLFALVDEQIAMLRISQAYFVSAMLNEGGPAATTYFRLTVRQLRTLACIRLLCGHGFDAAARFQLRLLYETSLIWTRFRVDATTREKFESSVAPEESNKFWHDFVSKQKTEKFLRHEISARGWTWLGLEPGFLDGLLEIFGLVCHPTPAALWIDAMHDWHHQDGSIVPMAPSKDAAWTLASSIAVAALPFAIKPEPSYGFPTCDDFGWFPLPHSNLEGEAYHQSIRDMQLRLFMISLKYVQEMRKADSTS